MRLNPAESAHFGDDGGDEEGEGGEGDVALMDKLAWRDGSGIEV